MPKNPVETRPINKDVFMRLINKRGFSIRKLGSNEYGICSEKTLRSALNNGKIRPHYLDAIGELLDVETNYLSGESLDKRIQFTKNINSNYEVLLNNYVAKIDEHPYAMKEIKDFKKNSIYKYLSNIFSIFNISIEQFKQLEISDQYRSEEHTSELQSRFDLVCRLLLEKKK